MDDVKMKIFITGNLLDVIFLSGFIKQFYNYEIITQKTNNKNFGYFKNFFSADLVHIISINPSGFNGLAWIIIFSISKLMGKPILLHWQGTDVLELNPLTGKVLSYLVPNQTAQSSWLCDELEPKNVSAQWVAIVPPLPSKKHPLPEKFTVLVYLGITKERETFYGVEKLEKLAKEFNNLRFIVIGNTTKTFDSQNITNLGYVDYDTMDEVYSKSSVIVRLADHDGLPFMVFEALARGRYVVWNKEFPFCLYAENIENVSEHLRKLEKNPILNLAGQRYVENQFNPRICAQTVSKIYEEMVMMK